MSDMNEEGCMQIRIQANLCRERRMNGIRWQIIGLKISGRRRITEMRMNGEVRTLRVWRMTAQVFYRYKDITSVIYRNVRLFTPVDYD